MEIPSEFPRISSMMDLRKFEPKRFITNERSRGYAIQLILLCGFVGLLLFFVINTSSINETFVIFLLSAVTDFFDGFFARLLKIDSSLGIQLDSSLIDIY